MFLNRLAARNKILSDRSGYSAESGLGGTTVAGRSIELTPNTIDNPDDFDNQVLTAARGDARRERDSWTTSAISTKRVSPT